MEVYDVRFLQDALDDLEEIVLHIAQDNIIAALQMHEKNNHESDRSFNISKTWPFCAG